MHIFFSIDRNKLCYIIKFFIRTDKAVSTWDYFVHNSPQSIQDHLTADVTTDSYHKYKEDVDIMKNLGVSNSNVF